MDRFQDRQHVWLRSSVHRGYLNANSDGKSVSLRSRRASLQAAWAVHIYHGDGGAVYLLLHSAAYGRYLAATATRAPFGRGFRTEQSEYNQVEVHAIMWRAMVVGLGNEIVLRNVGGRYLRANGKILRCNNDVTVDDIASVSNMMYWTVEPIPLREPGMPAPIPTRIPRELSVMLGHDRSVWRVIRFVQASEEGLFTDVRWSAFLFNGRYVYHLRNELAKRIDNDQNFAMCVRAGRYGRLTPLIVNLPHGGDGETLEIVVYISNTPAYNLLRHPDVRAKQES
ncbi:unnamed protein product [Triticum turgidum subsp. durum]|uniref:DUF569 domain-containing protein n=1 Tax=Triticum turgidum subsp. durum TaxID=4567 RepID=A0A9R1QRJ0_TRITD|nr:unnamed protein product [Triticum turgidum subsp. durum]